MSNATLDDLFSWAAQQYAIGNTQITVQLAMTSNDPTHNNLVSYSEGVLSFLPTSFRGLFIIPAKFVSADRSVTQYFSDQRYPTDKSPFAPNVTDKLTVLITETTLGSPAPRRYYVTLKSSNMNSETTLYPQSDPETRALTAVAINTAFVTISLCDRKASPPAR